MGRSAEINFKIELDEKQFPSKIEWSATDAPADANKNCDSMMLSLWDSNAKNTMSIDLWTSKMLIDDMNIYFYQTFQKMADTYIKATNNVDTGSMIKQFSEDFAKKVDLFKNK